MNIDIESKQLQNSLAVEFLESLVLFTLCELFPPSYCQVMLLTQIALSVLYQY